MLIKKDNIIINLDNIKEIYSDDDYNKIIFFYNDRTQKEIYVQDRNKVFNDIIANYNSGKKVYVIE